MKSGLAAFLAAGIALTPSLEARAGEGLDTTGPSLAPHRLTLNVRLTVSPTLPEISRRALIKEAEAIWLKSHITLKWVPQERSHDSMPTLTVLVAEQCVGAPNATEQWPVGELLRFDGAQAIAVASITGARKVMSQTERLRRDDLSLVSDHRLGVILGRAVAHEIGHYLLQTNTHAPAGLMRANFNAREFADWSGAPFLLDSVASDHLRSVGGQDEWTRGSLGTPFSYLSN